MLNAKWLNVQFNLSDSDSYANITLISGSYLDISPLSLMPRNVAIQGKHHTGIRKLSGHQSTVSDASKCCHSRQTSHWYQEAIWISVHYLLCLEMLPFKANIILISGSYLDISPLSLMPRNVAIQGKHHTGIRKLSGYQSTISDALKCWHTRQTSNWYREAIWISVHYLWWCWNVAIQGKHHTDIRKLSRCQSTISDALKCCHSRQTSYWYQEAIWISVHCLWCLEMLTFKANITLISGSYLISVHYLWCLEMLPFTANITLISGSYLDISPLSLMPRNVAIQGTHHTGIRKLSGYQSSISDALKCCHSRQTSHWYQEAIWTSVHYLWCLEMLPFTASIILISGSYLDISPLSLMPWNVAIQGKHHTDIRKLSGYQSTVSDALKCCHSRQTSYWYQEAI